MDWLKAMSVVALGITTAILNVSAGAVVAVGVAQADTNTAIKTSTTIKRLNIWFLLKGK